MKLRRCSGYYWGFTFNNNKMKKRKAFNFYRSYYDVVVELPVDQQLPFLMAILNKQFLDVEPELTGLAALLYKSQKHSIDAQVDGYKNKMKITNPSVPPSQPPTEPPSVQEKEKEKEKEKVQVEEQVYVKNKVIEQEYNILIDKINKIGWNKLSVPEAARWHELKEIYG